MVIGPIGAGAEEWRRGLKMRTTTRPKIISIRRNIHFRLPVFFWYLYSVGMREVKRRCLDLELAKRSDFNRY